VLAFIRELPASDAPRGAGREDDLVLCVMNLSRFPQPTELDLRAYQAIEPVELIGGVHFPKIGELPYLLTLGGHGFYWFKLQRA
jgi:maltose alpha-D-glucosyltransferase/alpha-amylase